MYHYVLYKGMTFIILLLLWVIASKHKKVNMAMKTVHKDLGHVEAFHMEQCFVP